MSDVKEMMDFVAVQIRKGCEQSIGSVVSDLERLEETRKEDVEWLHEMLLQKIDIHLRENGIDPQGVTLALKDVDFDNGKVSLTWLTSNTSCAIYDSIEAVVKIHGHNGATKVVIIANLNMNDVRAKCMNRVQDDFEGVSGSLRSQGSNERYMTDQREWFADLFNEIVLNDERDKK